MIIFAVTFIFGLLCGIQYIYITSVNDGQIGFTLNIFLLFKKENLYVLGFILLTCLTICLCYLIFKFDDKSDSQSENYNSLTSKNDLKRDLLGVSFDESGFYLNKQDRKEIMLSEKFGKKIQSWKIGDEVTYKRAGFPIITEPDRIWLDPSDSHNLVIGTTNSGKTFSILFEMIELCRMAGESAIIVDLKGELSQATYWKFKEDGYNCICIDFISPPTSEPWNPLQLGIDSYFKAKEEGDRYIEKWQKKYNDAKTYWNYRYGNDRGFKFDYVNENGDPVVDEFGNIIPYYNFSEAEEYFTDVASVIYTDDNAKDPFWNDSAMNTFVGLVLLLCEHGDKNLINLESVKKCLDLGDSPYLTQKNTILNTYVANLPNTSLAKFKLAGYVDSADATRKSIKSVFSTNLDKLIMSQDIKNLLASNSIDFSRIGDEKTVIFLKVHDEKSTYYPLVNLFISQVYQCLIANARSNADLKLKVPLNILWDEFGSSPKFTPIMNLLSAGRSRGIRCTMVIQGYDQIESKYGKDGARSIKNNVMNKVYLLSGDESTLKEISDLAGKKIEYENGKKQEIPIFSTERLSKFQIGEALFIRQRLDPFYTKLLPYNKYRFYSDKKTDFINIPKPTSKWFDIKSYVEKRHMMNPSYK